ncbi:MAG TPA: hypothetical protein VJ867_06265 [Gemmatimonadaceae bacterium]|nr:hypothetical protein [Gemmatimonadaceae bacterium]
MTSRFRRGMPFAGAVMLAIAWTLPSCRDVPAPEGGVQSLAPLVFPSPGLVAGDTMRDSLGLAAPLRLIAFGVDGDTLYNVEATFVALDSGAHLDGAFLIGDTPGKTVRIIGSTQVLQTQPASVKVTLSPDTLIAVDSAIYRKTYSVALADTIVTSPELGTIVQHLGGATPTGVDAVIVRYTIEKAPAGSGGAPTLVLMSGSTPSSRDTTDATGHASRTARLRITALTSFATDTALVSATASYRGKPLGVVTFTLIFTNTNP